MSANYKQEMLGNNLRELAEAELVQAEFENIPSESARLLHNLRVHQIELEMQNDELRQSHIALDIARARYFDLYDLAPMAYCSVSQSGLILQANLTLCSLLDVHRDILINQPITKFICKDDQDSYYFYQKKLLETEHAMTCELRMTKADGVEFWVNLVSIVVKDEYGSPAFRMALNDITDCKLSEKELSIAAIAFESQEGMFVTDADTVILRVNQAFINITGYTAKEAIGQTPRLLSSGRQGKEFYESMWNSLKLTGNWKGEIWNRRKNGEFYPQHLVITAVRDSKKGITTHYVASFTDITMSKADAEEIQNLAFFDPLTSLPNRRLLRDRLHQALAVSARSGQRGALLFIDLDYFKILNDTLGHDLGDLLLQQVASRLISCVREGDTVARFSGDEFVVLLESLSEQAIEAATQAETIGNKILASLNQPYQLAMHEYRSTPSIGATIYNGRGQSTEELLMHVDIAMYQSKKDGRNRLRFFDQHMQDAITARANLERELHQALDADQFQLLYQTQVDSAGHILGAEALIRWLHPERGLVSPLGFIPLAEETGLILPIGQWVLDAACAQLKAWEQNTLTCDLELAVNVSAKQFLQADFVAQVLATIQRHDIKPTLLKLEITESMLLEGIEEIIVAMNVLKTKGIKFSLDDFGTGYSSLQYLKRLPLNQLKIDQSFISDIVTDSHDMAIVRTIVAMANNLHLNVIAEGVETEGQRQFLMSNGCTHYQGYLFSKPLPINEFEALLSEK